MYKIMNSSKRSFIVKAEEVIKGGTAGQKKNEKIIVPGKSVVEVTDKLGKFLSTYEGIVVVEQIKDAKTAKAPKGK